MISKGWSVKRGASSSVWPVPPKPSRHSGAFADEVQPCPCCRRNPSARLSPGPFPQRASLVSRADLAPWPQPLAPNALSMASFGFVLLRAPSTAATRFSCKSRNCSLLMPALACSHLASFRKKRVFSWRSDDIEKSYSSGKAMFSGFGRGHHLASFCTSVPAGRTVYGNGTWARNWDVKQCKQPFVCPCHPRHREIAVCGFHTVGFTRIGSDRTGSAAQFRAPLRRPSPFAFPHSAFCCAFRVSHFDSHRRA